jgi:hypothetical protein
METLHIDENQNQHGFTASPSAFGPLNPAWLFQDRMVAQFSRY